MGIKRTSNNSLSNAPKMSTGFSSAAIPNAPTIGTATATSDVAATVEYTAAVLGATGTTFTATSNPSSITGTGSSPITVTGLTASTAYTFTVTAGNANGTSAASSASNSITTNAPSGSYESIATVTVGSGGTTSITFSSIPSTYQHLQIRAFAQTNRAIYSSDAIYLTQINGSSANIGSSNFLWVQGTGFNVSTEADGYGVTWIVSNVNYANAAGTAVIDILNYSNTSVNKSLYAQGGFDNNGQGSNVGIIGVSGNIWRSTSAISSITFAPGVGPRFNQNTKFALYGIKGA